MPKNSNIQLMSDYDIIHLYEETKDERFRTLAERAKTRLAHIQPKHTQVPPTNTEEIEVCST